MREKWESTVFIAASSTALGGAGFYWNVSKVLASITFCWVKTTQPTPNFEAT